MTAVDPIVEAAYHAIHNEFHDTEDECSAHEPAHNSFLRAATVAAAAVRPLIAAEALEHEADWLATALQNAEDKGYGQEYLSGFDAAIGWIRFHQKGTK